MSYYKKLNLPAMPFNDWDTIYEEVKAKFPLGNKLTSQHTIYDPAGRLTDELTDILDSIGVKVTHIVLFCSSRAVSFNQTRMIHSDLTWDKTAKTWKDIHCGINWELCGGTNLFSWWDMSKTKSVYPLPPYTGMDANGPIINHNAATLNGIHYNNRMTLGIHKEAVKLDEVNIDGPILVRTDVPHHTVFYSDKVRVGVSLRIDETDLQSWDQIVDKFKPLSLN
jgi:hypothetical protein